jgi:hypothetical protein
MCPGKPFSILPPTEHVTLMSPKGYAYGGRVMPSYINIPDGILDKNDPDKVLVRLQPNELIIPLPHVRKVVKFLKSQGIRLPRT